MATYLHVPAPGQQVVQSSATDPVAERFTSLDSLRGLAAVTVVFEHAWLSFRPLGLPPWWLYPATAGDTAVILFFVLSGFVLSLRYWSRREESYSTFLLRRFFRIYVPFAASVLVALLGASLFVGRHPATTTAWFNQVWATPLTWDLVRQQFLLWPSLKVNGVYWTLRYEMQLSLLMPLICLALRRIRHALPVTGMLFVLAYSTDRWQHYFSWHLLNCTIGVALYFVLGAVLAKQRAQVRELLGGRSREVKLFVLLFSLLLFWRAPEFLAMGHERLYGWIVVRNNAFVALGASGILVSALYVRQVREVLQRRIPQYLGRISFSLYLTHIPVEHALFAIVGDRLPVTLLIGVYFVVAFAFAHLFCVCVEEPAVRLGKWVVDAWRDRRSVPEAVVAVPS